MSQRAWAAVRYLGTVAITALTGVLVYYPDVHWIPIVILVLGTLGFHVVPTAPPVYKTVVPPTQAPITRWEPTTPPEGGEAK